MLAPGLEQYFSNLATVATHLDAEGFDDFTPVQG